jgi:hypothetical protein
MIFKVDIDISKTRTWRKYSKWLRHALLRLKEGHQTFYEVQVYKTAHGYHLYLEDHIRWHSNDYINLIECLLGSDINKQLYFYAEGTDILFKTKNKVMEKFDMKKTKQIGEYIAKARVWTGYKKFVIA